MKPRIAAVVAMFFVVAYVAGVVAIYWYHLGTIPFSTTTAESWGQFGDYVGGLLNPLFSLLNVAAVIYIAFAVQRFGEAQRRAEEDSESRIQTVVDLHREWNSGSIYESRTIAGSLIRQYPDQTIFQIEKQVPYEKAAHIWVVIGFFQRLSFQAEHDRLHKKMALELFAELFVWWWILSFEKQLVPCECDARDRMVTLKKWIFENTTEVQRVPWTIRAQKDLEEAVETASSQPFIAFG